MHDAFLVIEYQLEEEEIQLKVTKQITHFTSHAGE